MGLVGWAVVFAVSVPLGALWSMAAVSESQRGQALLVIPTVAAFGLGMEYHTAVQAAPPPAALLEAAQVAGTAGAVVAVVQGVVWLSRAALRRMR